jgi:hypothetical protein
MIDEELNDEYNEENYAEEDDDEDDGYVGDDYDDDDEDALNELSKEVPCRTYKRKKKRILCKG